MSENEFSSETEQKITRFQAEDLQHYIRKYRLTRPLTEVEEQLLNEKSGELAFRTARIRARKTMGFPILHSPAGVNLAMLRALSMAFLVAATLALMLPPMAH